jgi:thioesterase domain-containing protein
MAESEVPDQHTNAHADRYADDAMSDYSESTGSVRKPLNTFDIQEEDDEFLEDGFDIRCRRSSQSRRSRRRTSWWQNMIVRARRKISMDDLKNGLDEALLQDSFAMTRRSRRKRTWYNYCIFGGISGLTIL